MSIFQPDPNDEFDESDRYNSAAGWDPHEPYKKLIAKFRREQEKNDPGPNPLVIRTGRGVYTEQVGNTGASLLGNLWHQDEIAVMFADTGVGKSVFAVQIAESIARGTPIEPFGLTAPPQRVLYVDFEMTCAQFNDRYTCPDQGIGIERKMPDLEDPSPDNSEGRYPFHSRFMRAHLPSFPQTPERFRDVAEYLGWAIVYSTAFHQPGALIVDNVGFLSLSSSYTGPAVRMMKALKNLRNGWGISILVVAHTPRRSEDAPIALRDIYASQAVANFADNVFALGRSAFDADLRYVKHLKARSTRFEQESGLVPAFRLGRSAGPAARMPEPGGSDAPPKAFLGLTFIDHIQESEMLRRRDPEAERERMAADARSLQKMGLSLSGIAARLGISKATAGRYCRRGEESCGFADLPEPAQTGGMEND